jgi:hypothetical protein
MVNLAMYDFLKNSTYAVLDPLQNVIHTLPRSGKSEFASMSRINEARWSSCHEVVMYLLQHSGRTEAYFQRAALNEPSTRLTQLRLLDFAQIVNIFSNLILRVEANSNLYSNALLACADALHRLGQLRVIENRSFGTECLTRRFASTADFADIVATSILSAQGHDHLEDFRDLAPTQCFSGVGLNKGLFPFAQISELG